MTAAAAMAMSAAAVARLLNVASFWSGKDLYPVLLALMTWGDRWYSGTAGPPARIHHLTCGHDTTAVSAWAHCGAPLAVDNTTQLPGPGGRTGPGTRVLGPLLASRRPR